MAAATPLTERHIEINMHQRTRKDARRQRGRGKIRRAAAIVEFALTAPLLFLLLLGAIDVGQFVNAGQVVSDASREGARLAARADTTSVDEVESAVLTYLGNCYPNMSSEALATATGVSVTDAEGDTISGTNLSSVATGAAINVDVTFQFDAVRWLNGVNFAANKVLQTTTMARRE